MSEIIFNSPKKSDLINDSVPTSINFESQIENLQTTLASLNQQVIFLQETIQERDQEIAELEMRLVQSSQELPQPQLQPQQDTDEALTITGLLINLYKLVFRPGKDSPVLNRS